VWAISCDPVGNGNYKVKYGTTYSSGNGENFYWAFTQSGTAGGTSVTVKGSVPYVVSISNTVWYQPQDNDLWYYFPTNRCEGGNVSIQQVVGDPSIAVGEDGTIFVIESGGTPSNTLRKWTGSCWQRSPVLPEGSAKEVAIFDNNLPGQRNLPWVATTTGNFYRLTSSNVWQIVSGGQGYGVSLDYVIGLDTSGRWGRSPTTGVFTKDTTWTGGTIRQQDNSWVVTDAGPAYHWE
jgi:hypothetical protein